METTVYRSSVKIMFKEFLRDGALCGAILFLLYLMGLWKWSWPRWVCWTLLGLNLIFWFALRMFLQYSTVEVSEDRVTIYKHKTEEGRFVPHEVSIWPRRQELRPFGLTLWSRAGFVVSENSVERVFSLGGFNSTTFQDLMAQLIYLSCDKTR